MKILAKNKRATFDYAITERIIVGLVLTGQEVKSIKAAHVSLKGSFISLSQGEAYLTGAHVSPYGPSATKDYNPTRNRKLLLHKKEIDKLIANKRSGLSVVPTVIALDRNHVKLEIGIGSGKKRYDKRQAIRNRETAIELNRIIKKSNKNT